MSVIYHKFEQQSLEWFAFKVGKLSQSELKRCVNPSDASLKSKDVVMKQVSKIIAEIITGFSQDSDYQSDAMEWGNEYEEEALEPYSSYKRKCGIIQNTDFKYFVLSPDLVTFDKLGFEAKCPDSDTHINYILADRLPLEHKVQVNCYYIADPSIQKMHFISYDPRCVKSSTNDIICDRFKIDVEKDYRYLDNLGASILMIEDMITNGLDKLMKIHN